MLKNFINNVYPKILNKIFSPFDIESRIIVGIWSFVFLIGCAYSIWTTKQVTQPVAVIFSTVIGAFAGHKIANILKGTNSNNSSEDKNVDVQGEDNDDNTDKLSK
jgi:hypothetical protein